MEIQFPLFVVGLSVGVALIVFALIMSSVSIESKISDIRAGYVYLQTEVRHLRRALEESESKSEDKGNGPMRGVILAKGLSEEDMASVNDKFLELTNKTIEELKYSELAIASGIPALAEKALSRYCDKDIIGAIADQRNIQQVLDEQTRILGSVSSRNDKHLPTNKCPYCGTGYIANERTCEKCGAPR